MFLCEILLFASEPLKHDWKYCYFRQNHKQNTGNIVILVGIIENQWKKQVFNPWPSYFLVTGLEQVVTFAAALRDGS